jgi:hypothetical protein
MVIDDSCDPYRAKIEWMFEFFSKVFPGTKDFPCTIKMTADIEKDFLLLSPNRNEAPSGARDLKNFNGILIPSASDNPYFTLLIAERQFVDSQHVHTLAHELAHLQDYSRFFEENGNLNTRSKEEQNRLHYWEFYCWSEFHAKRVGLWFYSIYTWYFEHGLDMPPDDRYSFAIDPQTKSVQEPLDRFLAGRASASANDLLWDLVIALVGYYARLSLDEAIDQDSIPDPAFPREGLVLALGQPALELFKMLKGMRTYEEAIPALSSLNVLFGKITAKLNAGSPWWFPRPDFLEQLSTVQNQIHRAVESLGRFMSMTDEFKSYADIAQSLSRGSSGRDEEDKDKPER